MFNANLTNCDKEPIHIPGRIQGHGFLIAADQDYKIVFCSQNVEDFILVPPSSLLDKPLVLLENFLETNSPAGFLVQLILLGLAGNNFESFNPYSIEIKGQAYNLILSSSGLHYVLEFEPDHSNLHSDLQRVVGHSLSEMLGDSDLDQLLHKAAAQIKKIIGYDRVMVYQFLGDGHGAVVAEERNEELSSWLGLHYPASDIPQQARELYKINHTRLISNVDTGPSPIVTYNNPEANPLDLTHSVLRAVSPIHIQYLKNMGVSSSFSISILHHGELWGLIACHSYTPRFINFKERDSAKLIGQVLSSAISFRQQEEDLLKSNRLKQVIVELSKALLRNSTIEDALFSQSVTLLHAVDASGVLMSYNDQYFKEGHTPDDVFIKEIIAWLNKNMDAAIYESSSFPIQYPAALRFTDCASGIVACRLSKELNEYIIWFRPEVLSTIDWAGNPEKEESPLNNEAGTEQPFDPLLQINPRESFETWTQTVRFTSEPWKIEDLKSALLVREEIAFAIGKKANEIRVLNEKLKEAYDELDTFSYTISHDLKNPLTSIKSYAQLLERNGSLDAKGKQMVDRILISTSKMQTMIHEVLRYSQVGQHKTFLTLVDMEKMLQDLKEELMVANLNTNLEIVIEEAIEIYGDPTMVMQVFSNLLGNAVKYSKKSTVPRVRVSCQDKGSCIQYSITDNGIGISQADQDRIFDLFTRSNDVAEYEGTGVGLSIVKKIMEKHHGRIWVDSTPQLGSAFHVSFIKHKLEV
jgi:chemotaxis family two-component system sensor kinase Cph1